MAEHFARALVDDPDAEFMGAGTLTSDGRPASSGALIAMSEAGIDISGHRSRDLWSLELDGAVVLALGADHVAEIRRRRPGVDVQLLDPGGNSVADPYGSDLDAYRATRDQVRKAVEARFGVT